MLKILDEFEFFQIGPPTREFTVLIIPIDNGKHVVSNVSRLLLIRSIL